MEKIVELNKTYEVKIVDLGVNGEGIGKFSGFTLFVDGALPDEVVLAKVVKLGKSFGNAEVVDIVEPSPFRVKPSCEHFGECGGCSIMSFDYEQSIKYKEKRISDSLKRIGGAYNLGEVSVLGMDNPFHYRNNAQFPVGCDENGTYLGFYAPKSHKVIRISDCKLLHESAKQTLEIVEQFLNKSKIPVYDPKTGEGLIRHVVYRAGFTTKEQMVILVINGDKLPSSGHLISSLKKVNGMKSICINVNKERNSATLGSETIALWGEPFYHDYIGNFKFRISANAFYQINPAQTENLYKKVVELGKLEKNDVVIDAYCGIGTISIYVSNLVKEVHGVEAVPHSILDAQHNAELNSVENVKFYEGLAENVVGELLADEEIKPNVVIVDPPRKGCHPALLEAIVNCSSINKLIYVSCDTATLARDVAALSKGGFNVVDVAGFDMFPMTMHVESVVLLTRVG